MQPLIDVLPWVLSAITIYANWLAGSKSKHAWPLSIGNQLLWLIWIVLSGTWGFLPMNIALWIVFIRNHLAWSREAKTTSNIYDR